MLCIKTELMGENVEFWLFLRDHQVPRAAELLITLGPLFSTSISGWSLFSTFNTLLGYSLDWFQEIVANKIQSQNLKNLIGCCKILELLNESSRTKMSLVVKDG